MEGGVCVCVMRALETIAVIDRLIEPARQQIITAQHPEDFKQKQQEHVHNQRPTDQQHRS
jgi:hypothetical protein